MSNLVEHVKTEMKLAGLEDDGVYGGMLYRDVMQLIELFSKQGHDSISAAYTLKIFDALAHYKNLSPVSIEDFVEVAPGDWQCKRNSALFLTRDKKSYRNVETGSVTTFYEGKPDINDPMKYTVAIDFDGVIHSYKNGWQGNTNLRPPVPGAADAINALSMKYKVVIYSTRAQTFKGYAAISEYLKKIGVIETLEITDKKPSAVCCIDDRAISFRGDWKKTIGEIENFRSWVDEN
jgi:hypothetical protein